MIYETVIATLRRLLDATRTRQICWTTTKDELNDWYCTTLGGREICLRFLYFEATNRVGADPHIIELHMPGLTTNFACGTEGYYLLLELLEAAFDEWQNHVDGGMQFLDQELPPRSS